MRFICESKQFLSAEQERSLYDGNIINSIHKTKLLPIYIVEAPDQETLIATNLFDTVRPPQTFCVANDVRFSPHVDKKHLVEKHMVGWGTIKVAVLDSGIDSTLVNPGYVKDFTGYGHLVVSNHGNMVAQIVKYYAPGSQILSLKVAHHGQDIDEDWLFMALDHAMELGVDIINMSLGHKRECFGTCQICNYTNKVVDAGFTVVAASGNDGNHIGNTIDCPGAADRAITVGYIDPEKNIDIRSGKGIRGFNKPNLVAPGHVRVVIRRIKKKAPEIEDRSGSSFAAPVVSGILASLFSIFEQRDKVISRLLQSSESLGLPQHKQGFGLVDLKKVVEVCSNDPEISRRTARQNES